ncbi:MAG TPA: S41 family peptidase [Candidatus Polarisedimenticolia bacterium]|nr:S41 family peptidase [Candidatus Polarisedimenticolia bacterium]
MKTRLRGLFVGLVAGFLAVFLAGMMVTRNLALDSTYGHLRLFNEVLSLINKSYVDEVENASLMKGAYEGMLSELDPFSEYLTAEEYEKAAQAAEKPPGPAAPDTGLRVARREGIVLVVAVKPGSDAEAKGITPGDQLRRVGGQSAREMSLHAIESSLAGPSGSAVAVLVARREEPHKIEAELERQPHRLPDPALEIADARAGIAVLRVMHFHPGAAAAVASQLDKAEKQKVRRLLIDLRGNAWGGIPEAARAAGLLLGDEVVARLGSKQGTGQELRGGRPRGAYTGSVALLVNGATAEAAELFAAAVRDGRPATLLGEPTFGIGAQQEFIPLNNGAWLKLSVRKYLSPSGTPWHGEGLKPTAAVSVARDGLAPAERLKEQLRLAIEQVRNLDSPAAASAGSAGSSPGSL